MKLLKTFEINCVERVDSYVAQIHALIKYIKDVQMNIETIK